MNPFDQTSVAKLSLRHIYKKSSNVLHIAKVKPKEIETLGGVMSPYHYKIHIADADDALLSNNLSNQELNSITYC